MGDASLGEVILDAFDRVKEANPECRLLLRSGDGRCWPRIFRAPGYS